MSFNEEASCVAIWRQPQFGNQLPSALTISSVSSTSMNLTNPDPELIRRLSLLSSSSLSSASVVVVAACVYVVFVLDPPPATVTCICCNATGSHND